MESNTCLKCQRATRDKEGCRCSKCNRIYCMNCIPDWRYAGDPEFTCARCDPLVWPNNNNHDYGAEEVLEWVVGKYVPGKTVNELYDEYSRTLPPPATLQCGQCSDTDCVAVSYNSQGAATTKVEHKNLCKQREFGYQYTRLVGWCCKCTGQAAECYKCAEKTNAKRAKTEVA